MPTTPIHVPPERVVPRPARIGGLLLATAMVALASPAFGASAGGIFADEQPLSVAELAALRGGFLTADGLELSFGYRLDLDIDDRLALSMQFNPVHGPFGEDGLEIEKPFGPEGLRIEFGKGSREGRHGRGSSHTAPSAHDQSAPTFGGLTLPSDHDGPTEVPEVASLGLGDDGDIEVLGGAPEVSSIADGTRYTFADDLVADVVETAEGVTLKTGGDDLPVAVTKRKDGIDLKVGDQTTTLVVDRISPEGIDSRVANRRDGAEIDHHLTFDVNVLNFSRVEATRKVQRSGRRLQVQVDRVLLGMLRPR